MEYIIQPIISFFIVLFIFPFIQDPIYNFLINFFGSKNQKRSKKLAGIWSERFYESDAIKLKKTEEDNNVLIKQFKNKILGQYKARGHIYYFKGNISHEKYVTGTFYGEYENVSYKGVFQLFIHPEAKTMSGKWIGFGKQGLIKNGYWEWKRKGVKDYISMNENLKI